MESLLNMWIDLCLSYLPPPQGRLKQRDKSQVAWCLASFSGGHLFLRRREELQKVAHVSQRSCWRCFASLLPVPGVCAGSHSLLKIYKFCGCEHQSWIRNIKEHESELGIIYSTYSVTMSGPSFSLKSLVSFLLSTAQMLTSVPHNAFVL